MEGKAMLAAMLLALGADTNSSEADQRLSAMATLYEQVCLKAFPDDKAVETLMKSQDARELTPEEVKVTMRNDPARGWELKDRGATVWVEFPPFHACTVRWNASQVGALDAYRAVADAYETARKGFEPFDALNADQGAIHIHMVGERRTLPDRSAESLMVIDQRINDPARRATGETGVSLRFVHQLAPPPPRGAK
jgi:hypothetical protein